jgi:twitching motility protein PilT
LPTPEASPQDAPPELPPGPAVPALLEEARRLGASDLHLTAEAPPTVRVDGELVALPGPRLSRQWLRATVLSLMAPSQREAFLRDGDADFSWSVSGMGRFRVNAYRQRGSAALAVRFTPPAPPTAQELGLPEAIANLARLSRGLVIVTGPTGSGKSTTLAALVDLVNRERAAHIVTLEDPIEYLHRHARGLVEQREVGTDTATFAQGLRASLRQDPDVILLGEMRDVETMSIALSAAETGHLVMTTLHTGSAAGAVDRVVDAFPPSQKEAVRAQLALTLEGVVAQTLLARAGGRGRVAAFEILLATPAVRSLIRDGKTHQLPSAIQTGARLGMRTLTAAVEELVQRGLVDPAAAVVEGA